MTMTPFVLSLLLLSSSLIRASAFVSAPSSTPSSTFVSSLYLRYERVTSGGSSLLVSIIRNQGNSRRRSTSTDLNMSGGPEIEVVSKPSKEFLEEKGVFSWGTWGCDVSNFPWSYDSNEAAYILKGKVTVTPTDGRAAVTVGEGDYVVFPAGMSCTWDVSEAIHKHFNFF